VRNYETYTCLYRYINLLYVMAAIEGNITKLSHPNSIIFTKTFKFKIKIKIEVNQRFHSELDNVDIGLSSPFLESKTALGETTVGAVFLLRRRTTLEAAILWSPLQS
jgi:hypothetical protein